MTDAGLTTLRRGTDVSAPRSSSAFDIPNVERFCTYKQSLDYVRRYWDFSARRRRTASCNGALAAFEATLAKEPNRCRAFAGAAKAAERLGDKAKARSYYAGRPPSGSASDRPSRTPG